MMFKYGTHPPEGSAGHVSIEFLEVEENWQRTRQDLRDMHRFCRSHDNSQIHTRGRGKDDGAPLSAHVCKIEPQIVSSPRIIAVGIGVQVLSIGVEYL